MKITYAQVNSVIADSRGHRRTFAGFSVRPSSPFWHEPDEQPLRTAKQARLVASRAPTREEHL